MAVSKGSSGGPRKPGRPPKEGRQQAFSLRLPAELHQQLKHYVVDHPGKSLNDVLVEAIREWWSRVPERETYQNLVEEASKNRRA